MTIKKQAITKYGMTFLLNAYKSGYFVMDSQKYHQKAQEVIMKLTETEYLKCAKIRAYQFFMFLTEKGASYVRANFMECLTNSYLYQVYPVLLVGDEVLVIQDLNSKDGAIFSTSHNTIPKGKYLISKVSRYTLVLSDGVTPDLYHVKSYDAKDFVHLNKATLGTTDEEIEKRFGKINQKALIKRLEGITSDNLSIMALVSELRNSSVGKDRIIKGN